MDSSNSTIVDGRPDPEEESSLSWDALASSRGARWVGAFFLLEGVLLLLAVVLDTVLEARIVAGLVGAVVTLIAILGVVVLALSFVYRLSRSR